MTKDYNKLFDSIMDGNFEVSKEVFKKKMAEKAIDRIEATKKEVSKNLFK